MDQFRWGGSSWYSIRARDTGAELSIYDEIGAYGVSAKAFIADIGALENGTDLELRLNSPGGSVFDTVAIYNALQRHTGKAYTNYDNYVGVGSWTKIGLNNTD